MRYMIMFGFILCSFITIKINTVEKDHFIQIFKDHGCDGCHSIKTYDIVGTEGYPDLSTLTPDVLNYPDGPKAFIDKFLNKKIKRNDKFHPKKYKGNKNDLNDLIDGLIELNDMNKENNRK